MQSREYLIQQSYSFVKHQTILFIVMLQIRDNFFRISEDFNLGDKTESIKFSLTATMFEQMKFNYVDWSMQIVKCFVIL